MWVLVIAANEFQKLCQSDLPTPQRFLRNVVWWIVGVTYLVTTVFIVIPVLLALVIHFYIVLPIRVDLGMSSPDLHLVDMWALGVLYMKIGDRMARGRRPNQQVRAFRHIAAYWWRHPEVIKPTIDFIGPAISGLASMLVLPPTLILLLRRWVPLLRGPDAVVRYGYPALFVVSATFSCFQGLGRVVGNWMQRTRDAQYLVELRLTNLEKEEEKKREEEGPLVVEVQ